MIPQPQRHLIGSIGIWPLFIILAASGVMLSPSQPNALQPTAAAGGNWFRTVFFGGPYLLAVFLALGRFRAVATLGRRAWTYFVMGALVLASALWSQVPEKVLINSVHFIGLFFVCAAAGLYAATRPSGFFHKVQTISAVILVASVAAVFLFPSIGLEARINEWTPPSGRWKGITDHANTLGAFASLAACSSLTVYCTTRSSLRRLFSLGIIALGLVVLIVGSKSMTATLSLAPVVLSYPLLMSMRNDSSGKVWLKLGTLGTLGLLLLLGILMVRPELLGIDAFFKAIGRDPTLTGRTQLWRLAFSLIEQKPLLGWSFDSLASVLKSVYGAMPYGQFHNGYIDLIVRGGFVGILLLMLMLLRALRTALRLTRLDYSKGIGVIAMFAVICVANFAEATFVTEGSAHWFLFVACWLSAEAQVAFGVKAQPDS